MLGKIVRLLVWRDRSRLAQHVHLGISPLPDRVDVSRLNRSDLKQPVR
jgi:hypothetical protein